MRNLFRILFVLFAVTCLFACGGIEDKEGNSVEVGKQYLMTEEGLELIPFLKDRGGNQVEPGKEYLMTANGLELIPYLRDQHGKKVEVGNEYVMTQEGLKLILTRNIRGVVQDSAGKPLSGVEVDVAGTEHKTSTGGDGSFTLPFVEGYVRLTLNIPGLPEWCGVEKLENPAVNRITYPEGWDAGAVKLPCMFLGTRGDKALWAAANGEYVDNGDGTVTDLKRKLMWEAQTTQYDLSWEAARDYSENLTLAGHSDWRLPTPDELAGLHESNIACGWRGPTLVRGALSLWSSEQVGPASALVYNVCTGKARKSQGLDEGPNVKTGVLAVRQLD